MMYIYLKIQRGRHKYINPAQILKIAYLQVQNSTTMKLSLFQIISTHAIQTKR